MLWKHSSDNINSYMPKDVDKSVTFTIKSTEYNGLLADNKIARPPLVGP